MSGGTPLIDKLLATPALQRSDLVPLKGQSGILQPDVITDIEAVANDTRLPSRAAVQRQLGVDPGQGAPPLAPRQAAGIADGASLSVTARLISAILGTASAGAEAVHGTAPLWPASTPPQPAQMAAALAQNVAGSGLFYEAHLRQFFSGQRSLAQLLQEPQASLARADSSDIATASALTDARVGVSHAATAMPAELIPLLRQQLELLALSQFRWSGEAWPGAGMDWEVTERGRRRQDQDEAAAEAGQPDWSSSLSMTLPRLGNIVLRLELVNERWTVGLAAAGGAAVSSMRVASALLRQRFAAAGLPLLNIEVVQLPQSEAKNDS